MRVHSGAAMCKLKQLFYVTGSEPQRLLHEGVRHGTAAFERERVAGRRLHRLDEDPPRALGRSHARKERHFCVSSVRCPAPLDVNLDLEDVSSATRQPR